MGLFMFLSTGLLRRSSAIALAVGGFALSTVSTLAADLGASCCADLEERVAELEATMLQPLSVPSVGATTVEILGVEQSWQGARYGKNDPIPRGPNLRIGPQYVERRALRGPKNRSGAIT